MSPSSFAELEAWLDAAANYELLGSARARAHPFRLDRMERLVAALGHPERAAPVVHVAGTKGKGTTCAAVASALDAAGLGVGLYTSPHLVRLRERIRIGAGPAPDAAWVEAAAEVRAAVDGLGLPFTYFELLTALALVVFRRAGVDVAVVEVGLGGRLDATNVVHPAVCVVTRIGRDHTAVLGDDPATIAAEKAGILAPGVPVVAGAEEPAAAAVVAARARELEAPLWALDEEVRLDAGPAGAWRTRARVVTPWGEREVTAPLPPGDVARNLALAVAAVERLAPALGRDPTPGLGPGLARLRWRGRCDVVAGDPVVVVDGAHEASSARALAAACAERFPGRAPVLVLGLAEDKRADEVAAALAPLAAEAVCCAAAHPRAADPDRLVEALRRVDVPAESVREGSAAGLDRARALARARGAPVVVTGSLYLAGEALAHLGEDASAAWTARGRAPGG